MFHCKISRIILVSISAITLLSGCSSFLFSSDSKLGSLEQKALQANADSERVTPFEYFKKTDSLVLGPFEWGTGHKDRPEELDAVLSYAQKEPVPVVAALNRISADAGIHIALDDKALSYLKGTISNIADNNAALAQLTRSTTTSTSSAQKDTKDTSSSLKSAGSGSDDVTASNTSSNSKSTTDMSSRNLLSAEERGTTVSLNFHNMTLEDWLNDFTYRRSIFWDYSYIDGKPYIIISATMDATFRFEGINNKTTTDSVEQGKDDGWEEVADFVRTHSSTLGTYTLSPKTGRIQINDRPSVINAVANRVNKENAIYSKEIQYSITFITYNSTESETFSSDVDLLYTALSGSLNYVSADEVEEGYTATVTDTSSGSTSDSTATINAINEIVKSAKTKKIIGKARNRTLFSRDLLGKESIVESLTVTTDTDTDTEEVEPTIEDIETGVTLNLVGSILSNNKIAIDFSVQRQSELSRSTEEYTSGSITLPNKREDKILSHLLLNDGGTVVLSDSDLTTSTSTSGVSSALGWLNYLFGGSKTNEDDSTISLIVIQAHIIGGK